MREGNFFVMVNYVLSISDIVDKRCYGRLVENDH